MGCLLAACCVAAVSASAEKSTNTDFTGRRPLSLEEAVQTALAKNADILNARQQIEVALGQVIEVRAQALPTATAAATYDQQDGALIANRSFSQEKNWRIAIAGKQLLYSGGQVRATMSIARATEEAAIYQLQETIGQVIATTKQQYYTIVVNRALIKVQEVSVQLLQEELNDTTARFEAGTVPKYNVLTAEVALANAIPDLIRARNDYRINQVKLMRTLGDNYDLSSGISYPYEPTDGLPYLQRKTTLSDAVRLAKERRPLLKAQRQNILIETDKIKVSLANYKPRLNLTGGYEARNNSFSEDIDVALYGWFFGVEGSWNIFDGLETHGKVRQNRALLESARITYEDSVRLVEQQAIEALSRLREAEELIDSQVKNVATAEEAVRLSRERFAAGAGTQLDVLNSRFALTTAQTTELEARYQYNAALAELDRATASAADFDPRFADPLAGKPPKKSKIGSKKKPAETTPAAP